MEDKMNRSDCPITCDGQLDPLNVSTEHFRGVRAAEDGSKIVYESAARIRSLKRWCKVVIVKLADKNGDVAGRSSISRPACP